MRPLAFALLAFSVCACARTTEEPSGSKPGEPAPPDRWIAPAPQQHGDVRVTVTAADFEDAGTAFAIRVSVENLAPTRRGRYQTWAQNATLMDNFGNLYRPVRRPAGAVTDVPLNPTVPVTDVLLFEAPIATAGKVELGLPGHNVGAPAGFRFVIELQTSGRRQELVQKAAAAQEAEAKAQLAAARAREAEAARKSEAAKLKAEEDRREAERLKSERLAAEEKARLEAEVKRAEAMRDTERLRSEAEAKRREAEFAALPGKLAAARASLEAARDKLAQIKRATSRYTFTGDTPPNDFFHTSGKYMYYTAAQKTARTEELNKEVDRLKAEIADAEARLKAGKP